MKPYGEAAGKQFAKAETRRTRKDTDAFKHKKRIWIKPATYRVARGKTSSLRGTSDEERTEPELRLA